MGLKFSDFAARYGLQEEAVIVTDLKLNTKFVNRRAANLCMTQLSDDFMKTSLTPASMQRVLRLRRTGHAVVFTQYFGKKYKEKFRVSAMRDKGYIVFTLLPAHGHRDELSTVMLMEQNNMAGALQQVYNLSTMLELSKTSGISAEQLAKAARETALSAFRVQRQIDYKYATPVCYAYHLPSLINRLLAPCQKHLEEKDIPYRLHCNTFSGEGIFKCDAKLFRYVLYSLISTAMFLKHEDVTLHYNEYPDCARLTILTGADRPMILPQQDGGNSKATCDSLSLTAAYLLMEKMQGELDACWLADRGLMFTLSMPTAFVEGAFKEHIASQLEEQFPTLDIEFSIL